MAELKPCFACNKKPKLISCVDGDWQYTHECHIEHLWVRIFTSRLSSKAAVLKAWNVRIPKGPEGKVVVDRGDLEELARAMNISTWAIRAGKTTVWRFFQKYLPSSSKPKSGV